MFDKFEEIMTTYVNGNIADAKNRIRKLCLEDRANFVSWLHFDGRNQQTIAHFTRMIITKDW